jgi:hypothetical protein
MLPISALLTVALCFAAWRLVRSLDERHTSDQKTSVLLTAGWVLLALLVLLWLPVVFGMK